MSTLNHLFNLPEQICYVQCGFCTTILLVSVPCSSLSMVVTVRCGHCSSLLSVNMMKASFVPFHLLASLNRENELEISLNQPKEGLHLEEVEKRAEIRNSPPMVVSSDNEEEDGAQNRVVNKPPEKRQRAPSAYNRFIKEEIRRIKTKHPNIPHKEAFSAAAKNWAHFPPLHCKGDNAYQNRDQEEGEASWTSDATTEGNGFPERKAPRKFANGKRQPLE